MEEEMVSAAREVGGWRRERFKGVVPQPNGHWGAQIYANQQRIWLGTFKSETSAAIAYDSAAMKLRHGDSHTNFPPTALELGFQSQLSTEAVLNMIRDGSYPSHLSEFLRKQGELEIGLNPSTLYGCSCSLLFHKELTPSDVGKLNRLVIPKRYAVKHFPDVPGEQQVQLEVYDEAMSLWKFRYCYWKSSQSFVFTRGWNRFVKDKGLRSNDTVAFYTYQTPHLGKSFLVIHHVAAQAQSSPITITTPNKGFKLFGVQID